MERSRLRTLLGLALLVIGVLWLSSALTRSVARPAPMPAMPPIAKMPAMPAMPKLPAAPSTPNAPEPPALPDLPALPAIPPPPAPPVHGFHGFWLNPAVIVLAIVGLMLWRRNRAPREQPLA